MLKKKDFKAILLKKLSEYFLYHAFVFEPAEGGVVMCIRFN